MTNILVIIGALANAAGSGTYVWDTLRGRSQPNRMTFLMWAIAPLIAAAASISAGVTWPVVPVVVSAMCPIAIFIASYVNKNAYWQLRGFDYICGGLSIVALVLWAITKDPNVAIFFSIASDGLAGLPTLIKAWRYPETETPWGYIGAAFSGLTGFIAAPNRNFVSVAFPLYLFVMCGVIAVGILRGRFKGAK
jgi:hypothetical protein